jgi:hypothetical protein
MEPLVQKGSRDVDIAAEVIGGVSAQKETVEDCRFALGSERIKIVAPDNAVTNYLFLLHSNTKS